MKASPKEEKNTKEKQKNKKRGGPRDDDDDVDEHGNLKGFIDYDMDADSEYDSDISFTASEQRKLKKHGILPKSLKKEVQRSSKKKEPEIKHRLRKKKDVQESEEEEVVKKCSKKSFAPKRKMVVESSTEEEEEEEEEETLGSEDTDTDMEEDDDEDYEDEEEEGNSKSGFKGISIMIGDGGGFEESERMVPKRHNMKKESEEVKKFVKLVSNPTEEETIDDHIDQFKSMDIGKQQKMLAAMERQSEFVKKEQPLMFRLLQMNLPAETMGMVMSRYNALNSMDPSTGEYYKMRSWMEKLVSMPLGVYRELPIRLEEGPEACVPFMEKAMKSLEEAIYGQEEAKLQIMQFIASKIANPTASGLSLLLIGPPGIGKTSLIKNGIAKALGWPFQFISLGGDSDATTYTGHQFVYEGSHCGKIANCVAAAKSMSLVMMFDELDKISATEKGQEIQNLLVHITDPVQNMLFEDKYLSGIPLDLSRTMFVFSANDPNKIDRVLADRMITVHLKGYEQKEKLSIAEQYLLPAALKEVNLMEKVAVSREVLEHIIKTYANEEKGVREMKRCIEQIVQRINMLRMFNVKELPFHVPNFSLPYVLKKEHVDLFLKKTEAKTNDLPAGMYT